MARCPLSTSLIIGLLTSATLTLTWPLQADEPPDYFRNSWSVIGLKDYTHGTRVTPKNELVVGDKGQKGATVQIRFGRELTPLSRKHTKRLLDGWLPVILITAEDELVRYEFTLWATPLPTVKDCKSAFDGPAEGENFLNWIQARVTNAGDKMAEAKLRVGKSGASGSGSNDFVWSLSPGSLRGSRRIFRSGVSTGKLFKPLLLSADRY